MRLSHAMMLLLAIALFLGACAEPDPADRSVDAGADADTGVEADTDADDDPLTCENFPDRFNTLIAENSHCDVDEDCTATEFTPWGYCNCNPNLGDHQTPAHRRDVDAEVDAYVDFFSASDCYDMATNDCVYDVGPITRTYCNEQGRCAVRTDDAGCFGGL